MKGWFRYYRDSIHDIQLLALSDSDFRMWMNFNCMADDRTGALPPVEGMALALRCSPDALLTVVERLASGGLIDRASGGPNGWHYAMHGWAQRQYKSDSSTERSQRCRANARNVAVAPSETETETETESSSSLCSEEECSSSVPSEELLASQPKSAKKPRASKSTSGPFNPTLLPLPVFVLWKAIVELRWRDDGVPEKHAREAAEVATWLYEKRNATTDDLVNWVRWWWKHPDSMGARQGSRPWPTNVKNSWDTCFLAPSAPDAGMTPAQKAGAEARRKGALVQAELDRRKAERERGLLT